MAAPRPRLAPVTTTTASCKVPTNASLSVNLLYPKFIDTKNLSQTMYIAHINRNNVPSNATEPTHQPHWTPPERRHAKRYNCRKYFDCTGLASKSRSESKVGGLNQKSRVSEMCSSARKWPSLCSSMAR